MKYISFSPYYAGLCNVLLSYELAIAISIISKRTLILPHKVWLYSVCKSQDKEDYIDIMDIFDKEFIYNNIDCIDFLDVPEFKGNYDKLEGPKSYTKNIKDVIPNVAEIKFGPYKKETDSETCLIDVDWVICSNNAFGKDFKKFSNERKILNISNITQKFIHFEQNLFSQHWYSVYAGEESKRNEIKKIINGCLRYNTKYYKMADNVKNKIGNYNSVHVRRTDFLDFAPEYQSCIGDKHKLLERIKLFFDKDIPLYICTDETDREYFEEVSKEYKIYFYDDFNYELNELEKAIVEQLICAESELFYGTYLSTFSSRINIIRGINGKKVEDHLKIDIDKNNFININKSIHWYYDGRGEKLNWALSQHPHWKYEKNGVYVDER